jgi:hypothetical protein
MKNLFLAFGIFVLFSCGSRKIVTTETKPTETIVFGKLTIKSETPIENKKVLIHFNERLWAKNAVRLDEDGIFYLKMPLGNNFLALVEYLKGGSFYKNIPDTHISINVPLSDKIYYIGDISLDWTPSKSDKRQNTGGLAGALVEANKKGEKVEVIVDNSDKTIAYFKQLFPDNKKEIVTQLIKIK